MGFKRSSPLPKMKLRGLTTIKSRSWLSLLEQRRLSGNSGLWWQIGLKMKLLIRRTQKVQETPEFRRWRALLLRIPPKWRSSLRILMPKKLKCTIKRPWCLTLSLSCFLTKRPTKLSRTQMLKLYESCFVGLCKISRSSCGSLHGTLCQIKMRKNDFWKLWSTWTHLYHFSECRPSLSSL